MPSSPVKSARPATSPEGPGSGKNFDSDVLTATRDTSSRSSDEDSPSVFIVEQKGARASVQGNGATTYAPSGLRSKTTAPGKLESPHAITRRSGTALSMAPATKGTASRVPLLDRLEDRMAAYGWDLELVSKANARILRSETIDPAVQVASSVLFFRVTHGFAATTSKTLQLHGKVDKFFAADPGAFENPGPPKLDIEGED